MSSSINSSTFPSRNNDTKATLFLPFSHADAESFSSPSATFRASSNIPRVSKNRATLSITLFQCEIRNTQHLMSSSFNKRYQGGSYLEMTQELVSGSSLEKRTTDRFIRRYYTSSAPTATPQNKQIIPVHVFLRNSWKHFFCSFVILSLDQGLLLNQTQKHCVAHDATSSKTTYCSVTIAINN